MILHSNKTLKNRKPLSTLDLTPYLLPVQSPKKVVKNALNISSPLKMTSTSNSPTNTTDSSSLLPSPFFVPSTVSSSTVERLPLNTLFESTNNNSTLNQLNSISSTNSTASPRAMMALEERLIVQDEDDLPPTPPRRLMDAFLSSASKIRNVNGSTSTSGNASASGSGNGTSGPSSPMASPISRRKDEEEMPGTFDSVYMTSRRNSFLELIFFRIDVAWTFYEDSPQLTPRRRGQASILSNRMEVDNVERTTYSSGEEEDLPKENQRPSPRTLQLRSSNINIPTNSQQQPPTPPHSHQPLSTPPHSRPTYLSISTDPGPRLTTSTIFRTTPPSNTNLIQPAVSIASIFPSWSETSYATLDSTNASSSFSTNNGPTSPLLMESSTNVFSEGTGHHSTLNSTSLIDSPELESGEFESIPSSSAASSGSLLARNNSSSSLLLLPGFALSPRKRSSTEGASTLEGARGGRDSGGSERKRGRRMGSEEASAVVGGGGRFLS